MSFLPRRPLFALACASLFLALPAAQAAEASYGLAIGPGTPLPGVPFPVLEASGALLSDGRTLLVYSAQNGAVEDLAAVVLDSTGAVAIIPMALASSSSSPVFSVAAGGDGRAIVAWTDAAGITFRIFDGSSFLAPQQPLAAGKVLYSCLAAGGASAFALACDAVEQGPTPGPTRVVVLRFGLEGAASGPLQLASPLDPDGDFVREVALDARGDAWVGYQTLSPAGFGRYDVFLTAIDASGSAVVAPILLADAAQPPIAVALAPSNALAQSVYAGFSWYSRAQVGLQVTLRKFEVGSTGATPEARISEQPGNLTGLGLRPLVQGASEVLVVNWIEKLDSDVDAISHLQRYRDAAALVDSTLGVLVGPASTAPDFSSTFAMRDGHGFLTTAGSISFHRVAIIAPAAGPPSTAPTPQFLADPVVIGLFVAAFGGSVVISMAGAGDRFKWLLAAAFWPLYAALRREQVLVDNMRRGAIVQVISESPGIRFRELSRRTGIAAGALRHHLEVLEQFGFISKSASRNALRFYLAGKNPIREEPFREMREVILAEIRKEPGLSHSELSRRVGIKWATLLYHVEILDEQGALRTRKRGRSRRYWPVPDERH